MTRDSTIINIDTNRAEHPHLEDDGTCIVCGDECYSRSDWFCWDHFQRELERR